MDALESLDEAFEALGVGTESLENTNKTIEQSCKAAGMSVHNTETDKQRAEKIFYGLGNSDRDQAVNECIVPASYKDAKFDEEKIKNNIAKQYIRSGKLYKVYNLNKYLELCNGILSAIRMRQLPKRSYLIGAPNGFGKSSFVNECLITLRKQGFNVTPYISLWELAQIKVDNEQRIMNPYRKFVDDTDKVGSSYTEPNTVIGLHKKPEIVTGRYSYSEYINADCLFVGFTDVSSKDLESHALYQLLNIRGTKGLPTIAMISTSLEPYENDRLLREQVWNEVLSYDKDADGYDRIYHVSCYKLKKMSIDSKDEVVDDSTGIVLGG